METIALDIKSNRITDTTTGKEFIEIADREIEPILIFLFGLTPSVKRRAMAVARKPIARIPARSKSATKARKVRKV
jgi:hypothetical protein